MVRTHTTHASGEFPSYRWELSLVARPRVRPAAPRSEALYARSSSEANSPLASIASVRDAEWKVRLGPNLVLGDSSMRARAKPHREHLFLFHHAVDVHLRYP